jgi:ribosome-associated protein
VISEGYVLLNGEVEYQKRKKVYHNDIVEFNGEVIQVIINENLSESSRDNTLDNSIEETSSQTLSVEKSSALNHSKKPNNNEQKKAAPTNEGAANKRKRKPISF